MQLYIMDKEALVQAEAVFSAKESLTLITNQYEAGLIDYLNVATAQTSVLSNERNSISLLGSQLTASVRLIAAIGGGWDIDQLIEH